jgi:uncharacterized membrane protein YhhN
MLPIVKILSLFTFIAAGMAIYFRQHNILKMYAFFKPLTTLLIIGISILIYQKQQNSYSGILIVALLFSLIGDIFLIGENYFIYGLGSFLLAHIIYTAAFIWIGGFNNQLIIFILLLLIGGSYFLFLRKGLGNYTIPVGIYLLIILVMNWQAIGLAITNKETVSIMIAVAAILFALSDATIAYSKFIKPFKIAEIIILSTYWIAIYTFTISGLFLPKSNV